MAFFSSSARLFTQPWFILWFFLCLLSFPLSGAFGYEAYMLLGGLLCLSQTIAITIASRSARSLIWVIKGAVWIVLVWFFQGADKTFFLYPWVPVILLPLEELLLWTVFRKFGKFLWTGFSALGMGFILLAVFIIRFLNNIGKYEDGRTIIDLDNEVTLFIFLLTAPLPYVWLTGYAVWKGYMRKE